MILFAKWPPCLFLQTSLSSPSTSLPPKTGLIPSRKTLSLTFHWIFIVCFNCHQSSNLSCHMSPHLPDSTLCPNAAFLGISSPVSIAALVIPPSPTPRKYPTSASIMKPNPLRPLVSAPNHFIHWISLHGLPLFQDQSHYLPPALIVHRPLVLANAIQPSSLSSYSAGLVRFTRFCDEYDIPENLHMPATEALLSIFITMQGAGSIAKAQYANGFLAWNFGTRSTIHSGLVEPFLEDPFGVHLTSPHPLPHLQSVTLSACYTCEHWGSTSTLQTPLTLLCLR